MVEVLPDPEPEPEPEAAAAAGGSGAPDEALVAGLCPEQGGEAGPAFWQVCVCVWGWGGVGRMRGRLCPFTHGFQGYLLKSCGREYSGQPATARHTQALTLPPPPRAPPAQSAHTCSGVHRT